jgi:uncharacterized delta-60 repeat protein
MKNKYLLTLIAASVTNLFFVNLSFSQGNKLDESFGNGGIVTTAFNVAGDSRLQATTMQSDGKIIAVGSFRNKDNNNDFAVIRFCKDGSLDPTFGCNGIVITDIIKNNEEAFAVAVQSDGKIIVGGAGEVLKKPNFCIARYKSDGSVDSSFGLSHSGFNYVFFPPKSSEIHSLEIQDDGKIIAAGHCQNGIKLSSALARFDSNGMLDTTFANSGTVNTENPGSYADDAYGVHTAVIQEDGKIIVGGNRFMSRYNEDGSIDNTFGINGMTDLPSNVFSASMAIGADKKIFIGGNNGSDFTLMRYNSNGIPDSSFGTDAMKVTVIGQSGGFINSIHIQNDGKIIVAGNVGRTEIYLGIVRYNSNGEPDSNFASDGVFTDKIGNWTSSSELLNDGRLLVAGNTPLTEYSTCFFLASFNSNGSVNNSFGTNGIARGEIGVTTSNIISMALQNDDKIVTAGTSYNPVTSKSDLILYRYNPNGILDNTFGTNGIINNPVGEMGIYGSGSIALQKDNKILVGGGGNSKFELIRFNSNGTLDAGFGENGIVFTPIETASAIASVLVQKDDKLIVAGTSHLEGAKSNFTMARYNANGSPDISFGENGIKIIKFGILESQVLSAVLQEDGKIIAGGYIRNEMNRPHFALVRCNPNGTPDTTFGTEGKVVTPVRQSGYITSLALKKDGKIVAAGSSNFEFALARYNPDGSLDTLSFGKEGLTFGGIEGFTYDEIKSMVILPDGKIMVTGRVNYGPTGVFSLTRYTENGILDSTFGTKGILTTTFGLAKNAFPYAMALQKDGKILLGGGMGKDPYNVNCITRYITDSNSIIDYIIPEAKSDEQLLEQNYPNPFNRSTKIRYFIPEQGRVSVKIYDLTGQ